MSVEKKSKEPKLTIRETPIIHYEVIDENGDGEPECDEFGNNLFETREEAERVLCKEEEEDNNDKTIKISDFDSQATDYLSELIMEELNEQGIAAQSFAFSIEVDYIEEDNNG